MFPRKIFQTGITPLVKAGTQVDEAPGSLDQRRQNIRCERIDSENMRQAIFGRDAPGLPIADGRIVNDSVEEAEPIHLLGHAASLRDAERSPMATVSAPGTAASASSPRCSLRACRTTLCSCSMRS